MTKCNIKNDINYWENTELKPVIAESLIIWYNSDYDYSNTWKNLKDGITNGILQNAQKVDVYKNDMFGRGASLNGLSGYVSIPYSTLLNTIKTGMTISVWIKKLSHANGYGAIVGRRSGTSYGDLFLLFYSGQTTGNRYIFGVKTNTGDYDITGQPSTNDLNKWVNITATYDGINVSLYKNNILQGSIPANGIIPDESTDIFIGAGDNGTGGISEYSNIIIGNVMIYSWQFSSYERDWNYKHSPFYYIQNSI